MIPTAHKFRPSLIAFALAMGFFIPTQPIVAQTEQGAIHGQVRDKATQSELEDALVELLNFSPRRVVRTDSLGQFSFENLAAGRYRVSISKEAFAQLVVTDINVSSGQPALVPAELEADVNGRSKPNNEPSPQVLPPKTGSTATQRDQPYDPMSGIGSRSFTIEEVIRYAGARFDPARLVNNFAGIGSHDDERNDIVVRGNSPASLVWQIEELPIENPNHFTATGNTGGSAPVLNIYAMGKADFAKGALGAQYGNTMAGVFDIQLRKGDSRRFGGLVQVGTQRAELLLEGPLGKGRRGASFLVAGRSSLGNRYLSRWIATDPTHQDLNLKFYFGKQRWGELEFFAIAGNSQSFFDYRTVSLSDQIRYQMFENESFKLRSVMGLAGLKYTLPLSRKAFWRTVVGTSLHFTNANWINNSVNEPDLPPTFVTYKVSDARYNHLGHSYIQAKPNSRLLLRVGMLSNLYQLYLYESYKNQELFGLPTAAPDTYFNGFRWTGNAYLQTRWAIAKGLTGFFGLRAVYSGFNQQTALEPRAALAWEFAPKHTLIGGYAINHQRPTSETTFYHPIVGYDAEGNEVLNYNGRNLRFMRSQNFELEYNWRISENWRLKLQGYYQAIDRVFVETEQSPFSVLNTGATFFAYYYQILQNTGKGRNQGVELTVEKFFSGGMYVLLTGSLFDSRYQASDGVWRNTTFNNRFIANALIGREFRFGANKQHVFFADVRLAMRGGRPYTPIDAEATYQNGFQNDNLEPVYVDSLIYGARTPIFRQVDFKIGCRLNTRKRLAHLIRADFFNIFNTKNVFTYQYSGVYDPQGQPQRGEVIPIYQRGFLPDLTYVLQF